LRLIFPSQIQQKRGIVGKALREPGYSRPAPFPYKEKQYNFWRALLDDTTQRFDENSKIIVVDGPPTGNKDKFAKVCSPCKVNKGVAIVFLGVQLKDLIYCVCWIFVMNFLIVEGHGWFTGVFQF
jgi:hypothetical protein